MRRTINEGTRGILLRKGIIVKELEPGRHRYAYTFRNERIVVVSTKPVAYVSGFQEYSTKDNLTVRFFIRMSVQIADATKLLRMAEYEQLEDLVTSIASDVARADIATKTLDELLDSATRLEETIANDAEKHLAEYGVKVLEVSPVSILIPRSLKVAFEAKVSAKKKAEADLEEARGRTATLRHLANAAELVEKRPVLLQLLLGQKARNVQFTFDESGRKK